MVFSSSDLPAVEGVGKEAVGRLARDRGHQWAEAPGEDGRRAEGVGSGIEGGIMMVWRVELAAVSRASP